MQELIKRIKRGWWLYKSAGLTFFELANIAINKLIYYFTWGKYSLYAYLKTGKTNMIYGYDRHIPKDFPKEKRKRALMAYLLRACYKEDFVGKIRYYFSNNGCPITMIQALNKIGYVVDVIDNNDIEFNLNKHYDLVILHNPNLIPIYKSKFQANTKIVYFEVVSYWREVLTKVRKRYEEFNKEFNTTASSEDYAGYEQMEKEGEIYDKNIIQADARIVLGDQLVKSFAKFPNTFFITSACMPDKYFKKDLSFENLEKGRKNFIFFGGSSHNVRKGLHLLLKAFVGSPYNLYVCATVNDFLSKIFNLSKQPNIHLIGYQSQGSKQFYRLVNSCNFVIHPSAAEGIPGGVLDIMKYGLIPIVSKECNIINASKIGVQLETSSVEEIKNAIAFVTSQQAEWLNEHAKLAIAETQTTYSLEAFIKDFQSSVNKSVNIS